MITILMILGGAAIGGAIGLLGRYHDNKVKKEYERGYKVGYQLGKNLYQCDVETGNKDADYAIWMGNILRELHYYQTILENGALDVFYHRGEFIKIVLRQGENLTGHLYYLINKNNSISDNRQIWERFKNDFKKAYYDTGK